jgi:hypothetical protein
MGINGNGAGMPLTIAAKVADAEWALEATAKRDWPTPASRDWRAPNSQDSQDRRNAGSERGQQLPNFVEHLWKAPRTVRGGYTRDPGTKAKRLTIEGQAEAFDCPSIRPDPESASDGPKSSITSPSSLRLSPEFVEWLMGWPRCWTIPTPGSLQLEPTGCEPPAMAWSRWLQRQRTALSELSWNYEPAPEATPEMRQMELL